MQALAMLTYRPGWTQDELRFSLHQTLVHLLDRQLKKAGLSDCLASQLLSEASQNVVTDFEVKVYFTPDVATDQIVLVADGLRNEIQQLLVELNARDSFQLSCLIVVDQDGTVISSDN